MSIRTVVHRLVQNGRVALRSLRRNERFYSNRRDDKHSYNIHVAQAGKARSSLSCPRNSGHVSSRLAYLGTQARRIFVDNILKRVTNSLAADLRRRAASRLVFGDSAPFFALVGVSLASGTGLLTKHDELDGVCWEIREAVSKLHWNMPQNDKCCGTLPTDRTAVTLRNFVIGPIIAKGCSAAVYAARFIDTTEDETRDSVGTCVDAETDDIHVFPLAIKMMFNYDAESNAAAILRAMYRETVPARRSLESDAPVADWQRKFMANKVTLPPHPNIVAMYRAFTDTIPMLPDSWGMYPDALPTRINPCGSGRNMSLFLLMKRYHVTLKRYVTSRSVDTRVSILLLAQLLEAVAHMNANGIAHRDLKSDNILLDLSEETDNCPSLVVTDFGCCLADKKHGLYLPYNTHDIDKGGNIALMAPEVITAEPGPFASIDYTKADVWTVGAIAYEIFGVKNPFNDENDESTVFTSHDYIENALPALPNHVPPIVSAVVKSTLSRNFSKRLDAQIAATIMQLYLWAPSSWFRNEGLLPSSNEIMQWLLCLTTKVLCEGRNPDFFSSCTEPRPTEIECDIDRRRYEPTISTYLCGRRTMPEYQLIASFLSRVTLARVKDALKWIQRNL